MTGLLTAADLAARLRAGGGLEPPAVQIEWRSLFDDGPPLEVGFDPESGDNASADDGALCGDGCGRPSDTWPDMPPWRNSYVIRPDPPPSPGGR